MVIAEPKHGFFILGGQKTNGGSNCRQFRNKNITDREPMPDEKSFFSAVHHKGIIYTFGGYDIYDKLQLKTCEKYDI